MAKLYITTNGIDDRENPTVVELRANKHFYIEDALKDHNETLYNDAGSECQQNDGECRVDDGPWRKWSATAEYDVRFVVDMPEEATQDPGPKTQNPA